MSAEVPAGGGAGGAYSLEAGGSPDVLVAVPARSPVRLLVTLAAEMPEPFLLVYVLLRSGTLRPEGRWQSSQPLSRDALENWLDRFRAFLEEDGRHGVWIVSASAPVALALDRRGRVEIRGDYTPLLPTLHAAGLAEGPLPETDPNAPSEAFDRDEMALFAMGNWTWFPLEPWDEVE